MSYEVAYASTYLIYLQSPEMKTDMETPPKEKAKVPANKLMKKKRHLGTLKLLHLESDSVATVIENVAHHVIHQSHVVDRTNDHFAYVQQNKETGRDKLNIIALGRTGGWGHRGTYEGEFIEGLSWAKEPITLGFLDTTQTTGEDGSQHTHSTLYTWHVAGPNVAGKFTRVTTPE